MRQLGGRVGIPFHPKEAPGKQDAAASEVSWQWGVALRGAFFLVTRTNSQRKSVGDSSSLEVMKPRQDVVLGRPLQSKPQVIGLSVRGLGENSLVCKHRR